MDKLIYDLLVIGGGINGAGIARDAAGRGLSVLLCEQDDLAAHTSSASTKLIHGGLRYLEHHQFGLVRKALQEREVLLRSAPHIISPLRFVMPHAPELRPVWMIRLGLFLYDHLARRQVLQSAEAIDLTTHICGAVLRPGFQRGFVYSDGWVQDARLVVLNALDAAERGATILTRTAVVAAARENCSWRVTLRTPDNQHQLVFARGVINAAGPWVNRLLGDVLEVTPRHSVRLVKGSHIIVPRLFNHPYAYLFQNPDNRIIFAIPFEDDFTLIGTTDVDFRGDPGKVKIDTAETDYLCRMVNRYFAKEITPADVVATMSGVRPLVKDQATNASAVTRDYTLELDEKGPPLVSIFGGKITTYRKLSEQVVDLIGPRLDNHRPTWTASAPLPGGDIPKADFHAFASGLARQYPWLPAPLLQRYARAYGTRIHVLLDQARSLGDLGECIVPGLYEREARYLVEVEWAQTAEDIVWRRSKLRLHLKPGEETALERWLTAYHAKAKQTPATRRAVQEPAP
ncbi:glycerol-3-phosphate dehydrogenase [Silvimonas amylolytica]|uniref:Glycerol-3-phosphate dehydrogenase n=1 Tax=Silvimonas amylolytica TaxID=449663 RepID=A0ABQ2PJ76_9NEIS|nr:glycerol-3-phosphate dehydrogenase [Silvimonas amylolytica]GGP25639.1 glycerol-3-phosphate dehydrogenase [Silvimonas amylolytica]